MIDPLSLVPNPHVSSQAGHQSKDPFSLESQVTGVSNLPDGSLPVISPKKDKVSETSWCDQLIQHIPDRIMKEGKFISDHNIGFFSFLLIAGRFNPGANVNISFMISLLLAFIGRDLINTENILTLLCGSGSASTDTPSKEEL